jgi:hypothetical protein
MSLGPRCTSCGHSWAVHRVRTRGLVREPWCDVAGCTCTREAPVGQGTVEGTGA